MYSSKQYYNNLVGEARFLPESNLGTAALNQFPDWLQAVQRNFKAQEKYAYENIITQTLGNMARTREPEPLRVPIPVSNLPGDRFPDDLWSLAKYLAQEFDMVTEEVLFVLLAIIGAGTYGNFFVQVAPHWQERVSGYYILSKSSGQKKTALLARILAALKQHNEDLLREYESTAEDRATVPLLIGDVSKEIRKSIRNRMRDEVLSHDDIQTMIDKVALEKKKYSTFMPRLLHEPCLLQGRPTHAALIRHLSAQGGHCNIIGSENPFEFLCIKKNIGTVLALSDRETIQRTFQGGKQVSIPDASLMIISAFQPNVLLPYYQSRQLQDCGFLNRLTVLRGIDDSVFYDPKIGREEGERLLGEFEAKIKRLSAEHYAQSPKRQLHELTVSPEAYRLVTDYQFTYRGQAPECLKGYLAKSHGHAVRFAAYLHLWSNPESPSMISGGEMAAGIEIARMLESHAEYFFNHELHQINADAIRVVEQIRRRKAYDRYRAFISDLIKNMNDMTKDKIMPACRHLESKGYMVLFEISGYTECIINPRCLEDDFVFK